MNTSNPNLKIPKTNSRLAATIYIVIAIATLWAGNSASVSLINKIVYFILGLLFFTLIEYLMHRFLYHSGPDYKDERYWQYKVLWCPSRISNRYWLISVAYSTCNFVRSSVFWDILSFIRRSNLFFLAWIFHWLCFLSEDSLFGAQ